MITYSKDKKQNSEIHVILLVPKEDVQSEYDISFSKMSKKVKAPGFRPGKAPKQVADQYIASTDVYDDLLNRILDREYKKILSDEKIEPIAQPEIVPDEVKPDSDWKFTIKVAIKPEIDVSNYKNIVKNAKKKATSDYSKKKQDEQKKSAREKSSHVSKVKNDTGSEDPQKEDKEKKEFIENYILDQLKEQITFEISDIPIKLELDQRINQFKSNLERMGISFEKYLDAQKKTTEDVEAEFRKDIADTFREDFILFEIAEAQDMKIEKEDLEKVYDTLTTRQDQENFIKNIQYYGNVMIKQKVLEHVFDL